jgi:hypothetical protein
VAKAAAQFEQMSAHDRETLQQMIDYAQTGQCRWRAILDYYGDTPSMERCGVCDNCVSPPRIDAPADAVASQLSPLGDRERKQPERPEWRPGDPVRVPRYGVGEVVLTSGEQVAVQFPDGRTFIFIPNYVTSHKRDAQRRGAPLTTGLCDPLSQLSGAGRHPGRDSRAARNANHASRPEHDCAHAKAQQQRNAGRLRQRGNEVHPGHAGISACRGYLDCEVSGFEQSSPRLGHA